MAVSFLNSNIAALNTQRHLAIASDGVRRSFERLSSGLRINRASDDAAGLAIASSLNVDSRIQSTGVRNVNDAISFFAIGEGALTSLTDITIRLKELAEQSANGVLTTVQRRALDSEAQALGQEYSRITATTSFNGRAIFNNSNAGPLNIQAGYDTLILSGGSSPDGTFAGAVSYATGLTGTWVESADLNQDGNLDLFAVEGSNDRVDVFLGNGDGTFRAKTSLPTLGAGPQFTMATDVNHDGKLDLIASNTNGDNFTVYIGNGNGTFAAARTYVAGTHPLGMDSADIDQDGNIDLVSADSSGNTTSLYLGNSDGTFKAGTSFATGALPYFIVAQDITGDGKYDLLSADYGGRVSVFVGNGDGTFKARVSYVTGPLTHGIALADVNGDGADDVITTDRGNAQASVLLSNGNGTFKAGVTYAVGTDPVAVRMTDVNGDGVLDLVTANLSSTQLNVLIGNGNGSFQARSAYTLPGSGYAVTSGDFNGDGVVDLATGNTGANGVAVFLGNGSSAAIVAPALQSFSLLTQSTSLTALTDFGDVLRRLTASMGTVGSNESRLEYVSSVLKTTSIGYTQAASQILDSDVAAEAATLARQNIIQQAGASVLAQANQQPALALSLLRGI